MKQGWEIKKLGDFIKEHSIRNKSGVEYPVYSVTNSQGFCKDYFSKEVASKEKRTYKIVPFGCFAYNPSRINVGSVDWQHCEENVIVSPLYVVFSISKDVMQEFLLRYLKSNFAMSLIDNFARGTVRANLKFDTLCSFPIAIPSREEQERIVAELDCLSGIIEKKREQLKELDALAESIFYTMFGDPITNEKGWEVKKWEDVFSTKTGKLNANAMVENGKYPFFTCSKESYFIDEWAFDCEALLLAGNNATAQYDVKYYKGKFNAYQRTYVLTLKDDNNSYCYFKYALENKLSLLQEQSIGGMTKYLTMGILSNISFLSPPLTLQQEFTDKIAIIEKQKQLIKESIAQTTELFNSRMAYYFN